MVKTLVSASILAAGLLAVPASAGVMAVGSSAARSCYEAAEFGSSDRGMDACNRALTQDALSERDEVATYVNRGILRIKAKDMSAAIRDFDHAIARDPDQAESYLNKGIALLHSANYAGSLPYFETALEKDTKKPALAHLARGMALEMSGNVQAAYRDYKKASLLDPKWDAPTAELARFTVNQR